MTLDERLALVREVGEEIITEDDLISLLKTDEQLIAYDGFEPSGQIHIAQGILRAINVNKMTKAGIRFKMWVADWHAWANNKLGGDLEKIQTTGKYFIGLESLWYEYGNGRISLGVGLYQKRRILETRTPDRKDKLHKPIYQDSRNHGTRRKHGPHGRSNYLPMHADRRYLFARRENYPAGHGSAKSEYARPRNRPTARILEASGSIAPHAYGLNKASNRLVRRSFSEGR